MSIIGQFLNKLRRKPVQEIQWRDGIVIPTPFGPVPENARRQACINMMLDPKKFMEVERVILRECKGDWPTARKIMLERYPEACPANYATEVPR